MPEMEISHSTPIVFGATPNAKVERCEIDFTRNKARFVWHFADPATGTVVKTESCEVDLKTFIPVGSPIISALCGRIMAAIVAARTLATPAVAVQIDPSVTTP